MSQEHATSIVCTAAETEDWLAMEFEERNGRRGAAVSWSVAHAGPLLSVASLAVMGLILSALIFG
jgi:hypothetical protein